MPGPKCSVCAHEKRELIEYAVLAGEKQSGLAEKYGLSTSALSKHCSKHLVAPSNPRGKVVVVPPQPLMPVQTGAALPAVSVGDGTVMGDIEQMLSEHRQIMAEERAAGHVSAYVNIAKERRQCLELKARVTGLLKDGGTVVNIDQRKQVVKSFMAKTKAELDQMIAERMKADEGDLIVVE